MANYFKYFPVVPYSFDGTNIDFVRNILNKASFESQFKENTVVYYQYVIGEGETPEMVSHKFYGSADKHWTLLLLNEILHPQFDWPMNSQNLVDFIDLKYRQENYANSSIQGDGITWAQSNTKDYTLVETKINNSLDQILSVKEINITANTFATTSSSSSTYTLQDGTSLTVKTDKQTKSYFDYEVDLNEKKRSIKILKPEFVFAVEHEFSRLFE